MSGRLMGGLTALVWMLLVVRMRPALVCGLLAFGGLGVVWGVLFVLWFRNRPEEKPGVDEAEEPP